MLAATTSIRVCDNYNSCGSVYAYVAPTGTTVTSAAPILSSFAVSSNNASGSFMGSGNALTFTWSISQAVTSTSIKVAGSSLAVSGTGSGPYTGTYTVTGNEGGSLPVNIYFTNSAGTSGQVVFNVGSLSAATASTLNTASVIQAVSNGITTVTTPPVTASQPTAAATTFTRALHSGSTGAEVTALQQRLKADGLYSGPITGTYGLLTATAVEKYQSKHGLQNTGAVGPATRNLLNQGK
jgi:hypothetical protein